MNILKHLQDHQTTDFKSLSSTLGFQKKNDVISVTKLWNTSIGKLLDCPTLSVRPLTNGCQFIISGSTKNSDLTISVGLFKKRLKNLLMEVQKKGNSDIWTQLNSLGC